MQIDTLNAELEDKQAEIREKNHSLNDCHEEIRRIQGYLEEKKDRIDGLEADIAELVRLRQELRERVGEVGDLSHELGMVKMQMRELDAQLQKQQREATTKVKILLWSCFAAKFVMVRVRQPYGIFSFVLYFDK